MPITMASTDLLVDRESQLGRPWGRYGLVLIISATLHGLVWHYRDSLAQHQESKPKPERIIEVTLVPQPPKPVALAKASEPEPKREAPKQVEPKPPVKVVTPPKPTPPVPPKPITPPRPKAPPKPKPVAQPKPDPKPEPPPVERAEPVEDSPPVKAVQAPAEPVSRPATTSDASASNKSPATHAKREGGDREEGNSPAHYLQRPNPEYPALAKRRNWEGRVVVRVKIMADGSCGQAEISQSSGHDILDEAALDAVCKVRYAPNKRNGQAVEGWANVPINFNLEG